MSLRLGNGFAKGFVVGFVWDLIMDVQACSVGNHALERALSRHKYGLAPL
jgi:hypothetical protein